MSKKQAFQYMVLFHEVDKTSAAKSYLNTEVVVDLTTTTAKNEKELVFRITREIPEKFAEEADNIEILVRPF